MSDALQEITLEKLRNLTVIDVIHLFVQDDQVLLTNNECRYSLLVIKAFLETYRVVLYTQYLTSRLNIC